ARSSEQLDAEVQHRRADVHRRARRLRRRTELDLRLRDADVVGRVEHQVHAGTYRGRELPAPADADAPSVAPVRAALDVAARAGLVAARLGLVELVLPVAAEQHHARSDLHTR